MSRASKVQTNFYLPVGTTDALRERAAEVGCSASDLVDLFTRKGLDGISVDVLKKWAKGLTSRMGRLGGAHTKNERAVQLAFDALKVRDAPAYRFPLPDIASASGLRLAEAFWALKKLEARGIVAGAELDKVDRWGRPIASFWRLATDGVGPVPQPR